MSNSWWRAAIRCKTPPAFAWFAWPDDMIPGHEHGSFGRFGSESGAAEAAAEMSLDHASARIGRYREAAAATAHWVPRPLK